MSKALFMSSFCMTISLRGETSNNREVGDPPGISLTLLQP